MRMKVIPVVYSHIQHILEDEGQTARRTQIVMRVSNPKCKAPNAKC